MITAIIQARMQSTRLPGKVLLPLGDNTVLENVVDRVQQADLVSKVIIATTIEPADDAIIELCQHKNIDFFRGDMNDVLDRYYQTASKYKVKHIARITSDCPLIDPQAIDEVAQKYLEGSYDYVSNNHPAATYPDGLDTEIFSFKALKRAWHEAKLPSEREHVTPYIWKNPQLFKIYNVKNKKDLSAYRLTIDEPYDYELLKTVIAGVKDLTIANIITFLDHNEQVKNLNKHIIRDEGYYKSLLEDNKRSIK